MQEAKEERKREFTELLRTKQPQSRSLHLVDNLEKVYDRPWHSVMLTPCFVTDSVHLSDQVSAAGLQHPDYNGHLQQFGTDHITLLDGVQEAVLNLAIKNQVWNEGLQNVKTAKLIITEWFGSDSDDVICLDNDILASAYMKWRRFDDAHVLLDNTLQLCHRKHGNSSLAAVQCLRNLAQIQRHKMEGFFQPHHAADFLNQAVAALEFSTALVGDLKTLAIKAAVRFELAGVYLECYRSVSWPNVHFL